MSCSAVSRRSGSSREWSTPALATAAQRGRGSRASTRCAPWARVRPSGAGGRGVGAGVRDAFGPPHGEAGCARLL
eukprot:2639371-Prymnesium_polylepis.1